MDPLRQPPTSPAMQQMAAQQEARENNRTLSDKIAAFAGNCLEDCLGSVNGPDEHQMRCLDGCCERLAQCFVDCCNLSDQRHYDIFDPSTTSLGLPAPASDQM